jgi:hypothetical protein
MRDGHRPPNILLSGGPDFMYEYMDRTHFVVDPDVKLKLLVGNRYEHFEPTGEFVTEGAAKLQVFLWTGHTYIAE